MGRASSRVLEARIRLALLAPGDPIEEGLPPPDDPVVLEEIDGLLSEAMAEGGGRSAENRAHGLMVRSSIMLGRGDLTSAVAAFEESVSLLVRLAGGRPVAVQLAIRAQSDPPRLDRPRLRGCGGRVPLPHADRRPPCCPPGSAGSASTWKRPTRS